MVLINHNLDVHKKYLNFLFILVVRFKYKYEIDEKRRNKMSERERKCAMRTTQNERQKYVNFSYFYNSISLYTKSHLSLFLFDLADFLKMSQLIIHNQVVDFTKQLGAFFVGKNGAKHKLLNFF